MSIGTTICPSSSRPASRCTLDSCSSSIVKSGRISENPATAGAAAGRRLRRRLRLRRRRRRRLRLRRRTGACSGRHVYPRDISIVVERALLAIGRGTGQLVQERQPAVWPRHATRPSDLLLLLVVVGASSAFLLLLAERAAPWVHARLAGASRVAAKWRHGRINLLE